MKFLLVVLALAVFTCGFAVATEVDSEGEWVDPSISPNLVMSGYVPLSTPSDNPNIDSLVKSVELIQHDPECHPRPQTIAEIHRMRESAGRIARAIEHEVAIMRRRKQFVEQMTAYLNDRIKELNKVKNELAEEVRWIELSQHRIQELSEREKLVKLQDILQCVNHGKAALTKTSTEKGATSTALEAKTKALSASIDGIKKKIASIEAGADPNAAPAGF